MTELALTSSPGLEKRKRSERRFRNYGRIAILISLGFLVVMVTTIFAGGISAFKQTKVGLDIEFAESIIDPAGTRDPADIKNANYKQLITASLAEKFPGVTERREKQDLYKLVSAGAVYEIAKQVRNNPDVIGKKQTVWIATSSDVDLFVKGKVDMTLDADLRRLKDNEVSWLNTLTEQDRLKTSFNTAFFSNGDSREPEMAGILGALMGTFFSLLVCFAISFPIGILTAVYLEEFAKKNRFTDLIEVNINNLAAVPSIVFGLLGLSIFLGVFNLPRSTPLVGGMVLALMTLPTIIIAARASLRAVPPSVRQAAMGLGASKVQTTFHHTVPLALPGMLTGTIIGMAQALGETAPLLMIGMVAFVVDVPTGVLDTATSLPVQVFLWADSPEKGFLERTSAAIMVLLAFLVLMNLLAVILRKKLERRW